jgi:hypothetical protein
VKPAPSLPGFSTVAAALLVAAAAALLRAFAYFPSSSSSSYYTVVPSSGLACNLSLPHLQTLTVIGDLHGDYRALLQLLRHAGLIPAASPESEAWLERAARECA